MIKKQRKDANNATAEEGNTTINQTMPRRLTYSRCRAPRTPVARSPASPDDSQFTLSPEIDNTALENCVSSFLEDSSPLNTRLAYKARLDEYISYCRAVYPNELNKYVLRPDRLFRFIFYQAMRVKKKRGGRKASNREVFDLDDYNEVIAKYQYNLANTSQFPEPPENAVGNATLSLYRAVLSKLHKHQVQQRENCRVWEEIWTENFQDLHKWVKRRKTDTNKRLYKEKVDHDFAPYMAAEHFDHIEDEIWRRGHGCFRSAGWQSDLEFRCTCG